MKKNHRLISHLNIFILLCYSPVVAQTIHFQVFNIDEKPINISAKSMVNPIVNDGKILKIQINHLKKDTNSYQYNFNGIDNEWTTYQSNLNIYYYDIPGGNYPFTIRRKDNSNIKQTIFIKVRPQLWQLWWFLPSIYLLISLIIGSVFYFVFLYRLRQSVQMRQVRNHIAADLHDEIGATLSGIGILSSLAQKNLNESHPSYGLLGRINDDALSIGNTMDDIVWSINPKNDDLESIIARMSRYAAELFDAKEIDYQIVIPENLKEVKLTMEQRRDVYLIFKEAVNNLVKYSKCNKALVEIKVSKQFELLIQDDGKGFNPSMETNRNGIKNMKNRANQLHGNLIIESEIEKGTSIKLVFII